MIFPKRRPNRLIGYDYSNSGVYFVTICTKDRKNLLWETVGASIARPQEIVLSDVGKVVDATIQTVAKCYTAVSMEHYVIMPNHLHLLLQIKAADDGRPMVAPTISTIIQQAKGRITKQVGMCIWQKSFHDRIIRSQKEYEEIWNYIEENPLRWKEDCFYTEESC